MSPAVILASEKGPPSTDQVTIGSILGVKTRLEDSEKGPDDREDDSEGQQDQVDDEPDERSYTHDREEQETEEQESRNHHPDEDPHTAFNITSDKPINKH